MQHPDPSFLLVHLFSVAFQLVEVLSLKAGSKPGGISPLAASFHAKKFDGFQYLDPVLIPVGTYIALDSIPSNYTLYHHGGNSSFDLGSLVADIVETEIGDAEEEAKELSPRARAASLFDNAPIKGLAGIRPLSTTRFPMGIFIPDRLVNETLTGGADPLAAGIEPEGKIARAVQLKVFRGIRKVVTKLKSLARQRQSRPQQPLDYNATFGGISPFEAVYLPSGLFIPLSEIPGRKSALLYRAAASTSMFEGIRPLNVMQVFPGVFIGHSLTTLPSLPPSVVPVPPPIAPDSGDEEEEEDVTPTPPPPNITMTRPAETGTTKAAVATTIPPKMSDSDIEKAFITFVEEEYNNVAETVLNQNAEATWKYETNVTDYNKAAMIATEAVMGNFTATIAFGIRSYKFEAIKNVTYKRLYLKISNRGDYSLSPARLDELTKVKAKMQEIYSTGVICGDTKISVADIASCPKDKLWSLSPEITRQMTSSRNTSLLLHIWKSWRDATGKKMRPDYLKYLELKNESAVNDGYPDTGMVWREPYVETDYKYSDIDFIQDVKELWNRTLPLYIHLHAYVRKTLIRRYPEAKIKPNGPIPAHLLGSQWGYDWRNLIEFAKPYQKTPIENPTIEMKKQNWTVSKMARTAEKFLVDLGLPPMPKEFWDKSIFEKPADRNISCTATQMDFFNKKDYRIKMCADTTFPDLIELHKYIRQILGDNTNIHIFQNNDDALSFTLQSNGAGRA
ncbi:hypothetical protein RvY_05164 [Ramazzottius varieornatus]|uniref:Angiotensin-converting enzyme n=1 Tax=Ramazzottius varieornatus TaxID=947166 RepID=A0A1D1UU32_RAMVA|nr:hypothetical protein RvY_05164 [Ramazzottius varieornatus]